MGWTADRDSFDHLMRRHLSAAQRFALRLCGNLDDADEVVQDALLRAARGWQTFRGEASFTTWLFRIIVHAAHDQRAKRSKSATAALYEDLPDERNIDPIDLAAASDLGERIARLVSTLPTRQREALVLTAYEGLSITEAAAVLETNEQNVRTNLHLARKRLRALLADVMDVNDGTDRATSSRP